MEKFSLQTSALESPQTTTLPPVSVIMAVFNGERYVAEAIESILQQTYRNFEFVIVDDGSTDRTHGILKNCAARDPRIRIISQTNRDQPASLNRALAEARHEWVAVIDHDDISLPHRLETQLRAVTTNPEIRVLSAYAIEIDACGAEIGRREPGPTSVDAFRRLWHDKNQTLHVIHPAVLMHRPTILDLGGYDPAFGACADSELWSRVSDDHLVLALPEPLVCYRTHGNNMSFTRFFEQRQKLRWSRARQVARREGMPVPALEDYLEAERGRFGLRGLNIRRHDRRVLWLRRARLDRLAGRRFPAIGFRIGAAILAPDEVLRRRFSQYCPGLARSVSRLASLRSVDRS